MRGASNLCVYALVLAAALVTASSCATKKPVLYNNNKPLTYYEYDKLAQREFDAGRYENAIEVYQAIIDNYSDNNAYLVWAYYEIGFCYKKLKDYVNAELYFRKVINEFQEPAATKLAQDMLVKILEKKEKKKKQAD